MPIMPNNTKMPCNICQQGMLPIFRQPILNKGSVQYYSCPQCDYLCTETPWWLEEAYSTAIAATDVGIAVRNLRIARQLKFVLPLMFKPDARFLDMAGGTGLLVRLMRDAGFDFYWKDEYCNNALANGFESIHSPGPFAAVTAFEALEHMERPFDFIVDSLNRSEMRTFIFSTELFQSRAPNPSWHYLARLTGQHISFFSLKTLQYIADQLNLRLLTHRGLHTLTNNQIPDKAFNEALDNSESTADPLARRPYSSLLPADHVEMSRRALENLRGDSSLLHELMGFDTEQVMGFDTEQVKKQRRMKALKNQVRKWLRETTESWRQHGTRKE